jgi:hypothetical protein
MLAKTKARVLKVLETMISQVFELDGVRAKHLVYAK